MELTAEEAAAAVERAACLACGAPAGRPCRTRSGTTALRYHTPRFVLVPELAGAPEVLVPGDRQPGQPWEPGPAGGAARVGYASAAAGTAAGELDEQAAALRAGGCAAVFREEVAARRARPELERAVRAARELAARGGQQPVQAARPPEGRGGAGQAGVPAVPAARPAEGHGGARPAGVSAVPAVPATWPADTRGGARPAGVLAVQELRRLARDAAELIAACGVLSESGVCLEVLDGPLAGLHEPGGDGLTLFAVLGAAAALDREHRRAAVLAGQRAAAARGRRGGRPRVLDDRLAAAARELREQGVAVPDIAKRLVIASSPRTGRHPSVASVYRVLAAPAAGLAGQEADAVAGQEASAVAGRAGAGSAASTAAGREASKAAGREARPGESGGGQA